MFVLTCPECSHRVRVKFAKVGVTAGCPSCDHKFKLDASNMIDEKLELKADVSMKSTAMRDPRDYNSATRVADSQIKPIRAADSGPLEETMKLKKRKSRSKKFRASKVAPRIDIPAEPEPVRELPPLELGDRKRWKDVSLS